MSRTPKKTSKQAPEAAPIKKGKGVPVDLNDRQLQELETLAGYGLNQKQIADFFKISQDTIQRKYSTHYENGKAKGNAALAQKAHQLAMKGDKSMLIFLAKVRLGWTEKTVVENVGQAPGGQVLKVVFEEAPPSTRKPNASQQKGDSAED